MSFLAFYGPENQYAAQTREFLNEYNQYWRTYFDPIALRVQMTPNRYRAETIVLPLIFNSFYTGLAANLKEKPVPLDALPVAKSNIFSVAFAIPKGSIRSNIGLGDELLDDFAKLSQSPDASKMKALIDQGEKFLNEGIGDYLGIHLCDAVQMFDFNFTSFMGEMIGSFNGRRGFSDEIVTLAPLVASLNSPVYVSIPVKDAPIVDDFLDTLDPLLAARARFVPRGWWFDINYDFYQVEGVEFGKVRSISLQLGPLKWRFFYACIGDGLYIASKRFSLDEIAQATAEAKKRGGSHQDSATAHAMIRVRPEHWNKVLDDYQLGWAENNRRAVLNNLRRLSNVARACIAMNPCNGPRKLDRSIRCEL